MNQLKRVLATTGTGAVLALSMVGAAGASQQYQPRGNNTETTDNSVTTTYTVSGNCSAIIQTSVDQNQGSNTNQSNDSEGGYALKGGDNNSSNSNSSSTSQSQSANVTFSPDCSTTTVAAAPAAAAPAAQVAAPKGGVHAGGGAGVSSASSSASVAGLIASAGSLGLGVIVRKKALLGL